MVVYVMGFVVYAFFIIMRPSIHPLNNPHSQVLHYHALIRSFLSLSLTQTNLRTFIHYLACLQNKCAYQNVWSFSSTNNSSSTQYIQQVNQQPAHRSL